jgi:hypothetical protein
MNRHFQKLVLLETNHSKMKKCSIKFLFVTVTLFIVGQSAIFAQETTALPCSENPNYRLLDFWIGDWEVKSHDGQLYGHNNVESILDGCVLMENWKGAKSSKGKSFNFYDHGSKKWIQRWVDNSGGSLDLKGDIKEGAAVFLGLSKNKKGENIHNRLTLKKGPENQVFQIWEQSKDSISWQKVFDAIYYKTSK